MQFENYLYLLPIIAAVVLFIKYIIERGKLNRFNTGRNAVKNAAARIFEAIMPKPSTKIYRNYANFLRFTSFTVEDMFKAKMILFASVLLMCVLVKGTNISIYTKDILNKYDYQSDLIYKVKSVADEQAALRQEIQYFDEAMRIVTSGIIKQQSKDEVEVLIKSLINKSDAELFQPRDTIANKIYHRIYDYHKHRKWNPVLYIALSLLISFVIEFGVFIYNFFARAEAKKELRFLKKLMIINGSIKPVDFMKLLSVLISKSKYHKKILKDIEEMNKKNTIDNKDIYYSLIKGTKDIELKLFYEKLDQANNYDFDQAIINIENEFQMEKRVQVRKIKKQTELIHAVGITGFMALIFILMLYLIIPWLNSYSMDQIL
ncbi:MAG: hypothetical protein N3B21_05145 [Clostridia bacterium]|nr:hypothetical protein [Clostridia bacterium]